MQQLLVGITQLPSAYVRPLWQPEPPALPSYGLDWMAMGIVNTTLDRGFPCIDFDPLPVQLPVDALGNPIGAFGQQHETIELQCTCYGEHAAYYDGLIADGFMVGQNQELLLLVSMALTEVGARRYVPELIQNRWWPRVDRVIRIHRERRRLYPILSILDSAGVILRDNLPECSMFSMSPRRSGRYYPRKEEDYGTPEGARKAARSRTGRTGGRSAFDKLNPVNISEKKAHVG